MMKRVTKKNSITHVKILEHLVGHPNRGMTRHINVKNGLYGKDWHIFF